MKSRVLYTIVGLAGLSLVIIVHEFGHFLACKLFSVATPIFSVGFGPALLKIPFGQTTFQIALLPLGGYVSMSPEDFAAQPYFAKMIILGAGVFFNIIFAQIIFSYLRTQENNLTWYEKLKRNTKQLLTSTGTLAGSVRTLLRTETKGGFIGPLGIINITGKSLEHGFDVFLFILALLSINIAFFNLLPIPFLDGGKMVLYTIEALIGPLNPTMVNMIYFVSFLIFMLFIFLLSVRDVRKRQG